MLSNSEAWQRLPGAPKTAQPLPAWARVLAGPLPLTTTRMLELDALHRGGDRLDARLRALARWAAADANGCEYAKTVAAADFARTGASAGELAELVRHPERLPALDRAAVAFARKMMREAHAIPDAEVKQLIELAGEERVVALVALLAHASFQDRVFLALDVQEEARRDPPPLPIRFARPKKKDDHPPAKAPAAPAAPEGAESEPSAEWLRLRAGLEKQRARPGRIRVPSRDAVARRLGADHPALWQSGIVWSRVCYGYQPELTDAWFDTADAFRQETGLGRTFTNTIFWVVTESLQCFY
jgi:alkylhydroperoxidase family enzyme